MITAKKLTLLVIASQCSIICAKISIPSIERVHKKVDAAKETATSLRDLLQKGDNNQLIVNPNNGIIITNTTISKSSTNNANQKIDDAEKDLNSLYWSSQSDLVEKLNNTINTSENEAAKQLKNRIKEKYPQTRSALVSFAQDLANEEQTLKGLTTTLLKLSEAKNNLFQNKESFLQRLKALYDKHSKLNETLQKLTKITNTLLM